MATTTTNFGWDIPQSTDLVKDGATAIAALGQDIDTALVDLKGGTTGQVLSKASNTDLDYTWVTQDDANAIQNSIVDAKGDLISASGNDVPARLAVGSNGDFLMADSGQTTGLRYNPQNALANPVINGGMDIWQRGTSQAVTSSSSSFYGSDRWQIYRGATGSTVSRQTTSDTTNLANIQYAMRIQRDSGNTSTTNINAIQNFESVNSIPFAGKVVTFSFYARKGANYSATSDALSVWLRSGTGTDQNFVVAYTGLANVVETTSTLTSTWQRFAYTGTVPTTATELAIQFQHNPTGTAGANDWFEVTGVQIDLGTYTASTAPTFRRSGGTIPGELQAAQRYYYRTGVGNGSITPAVYEPLGYGSFSSTTVFSGQVEFPVSMRVATGTVDFSNVAINDTASVIAATNATVNQGGTKISNINLTVASGGTQYRFGRIVNNNNTAGYLAWSAEL